MIGADCTVSNNLFSSATLNELAMHTKKAYGNFEIQCFSLLFGKCVNWSIDKTIYFSCHYIQSNDSLTALDANNSWLPHYHKYMYCFFKCTGKCTDTEGFLISLIQIIQAFFICTFDFSTKMSIFIGSNVNLVSAISWYLYFVVE